MLVSETLDFYDEHASEIAARKPKTSAIGPESAG